MRTKQRLNQERKNGRAIPSLGSHTKAQGTTSSPSISVEKSEGTRDGEVPSPAQSLWDVLFPPLPRQRQRQSCSHHALAPLSVPPLGISLPQSRGRGWTQCQQGALVSPGTSVQRRGGRRTAGWGSLGVSTQAEGGCGICWIYKNCLLFKKCNLRTIKTIRRLPQPTKKNELK